MKQEAKIIRRVYGDGAIRFFIKLKTFYDNGEIVVNFLGGDCGPYEYTDPDMAKLAALSNTFIDTIEE